MVFCKLCCIVLLNSWRRFYRNRDCIGSAWVESRAPYAVYGAIMARPILLIVFGQAREGQCHPPKPAGMVSRNRPFGSRDATCRGNNAAEGGRDVHGPVGC